MGISTLKVTSCLVTELPEVSLLAKIAKNWLLRLKSWLCMVSISGLTELE